MSPPSKANRLLPLLWLSLVGCPGVDPPRDLDPRLELSFDGPGRLAVIWHLGEPDDLLDRHLVVYAAEGAHEVVVDAPAEVRWLADGRLLVSQRVASPDPAVPPATRLLRVRLDGSPPEPLGELGRYYGAEPSPDGQRLAVGVDVDDQGESELEVWSVEAAPRRLGRLVQTVDDPRWSPDGAMLVVARVVDPEEDDAAALSYGGQSVPFPRLFTLESDLAGPIEAVHDGARGEPAAAGGSLPAWWDERGIVARQRLGLVRCESPDSGCLPALRLGAGLRVVEARPLGTTGALLLVADGARETEGLPSQVLIADLGSGETKPTHPPRPTAYPLALDWTP